MARRLDGSKRRTPSSLSSSSAAARSCLPQTAHLLDAHGLARGAEVSGQLAVFLQGILVVFDGLGKVAFAIVEYCRSHRLHSCHWKPFMNSRRGFCEARKGQFQGTKTQTTLSTVEEIARPVTHAGKNRSHTSTALNLNRVLSNAQIPKQTDIVRCYEI